MALTVDQAYEQAITDVKIWCRFSQIDNLLPAPSDEEIKIAINMALDNINSAPPRSSFTLLGTIGVGAWYTTLMYGACKNILWTLLVDWTANGIDAQLDSLSLQSKRPDYEALFNLASEQFNSSLEKTKQSYGLAMVSSNSSRARMIRRSPLRPSFHSGGGFGVNPNSSKYTRQ